MKESIKTTLISIGIFVLVLALIIMAIFLTLDTMNSAYKECKDQSDDYVVKDIHWNNITCGELKAVNTSLDGIR